MNQKLTMASAVQRSLTIILLLAKTDAGAAARPNAVNSPKDESNGAEALLASSCAHWY